MQRLTTSLSALALVVLSSRAAHAQAAAAEALFTSARQAMAKGDFRTACEQFRESARLDPAVGTDFNLADCEEKRGRLATAWQLFLTVEDRLPKGDDRLAIAETRARALSPRVPKVTLRLAAGAPRDTVVHDGATELGPASFGVELPMDPGDHEFLVSAGGREARTIHASLAEGKSTSIEVSPGAPKKLDAPPEATAAPAQPNVLAETRDAPPSGSGSRTLGWVLGGVGVVGLGVGATATVLAMGKKRTVDESCDAAKACSQAGVDAAHSGRTLEAVSLAGLVVGVVGVSAGAYFILSSRDEGPQTTAAIAPTSQGFSLSVRRTW
ncbi:MAG TPA: hypothetical protein VHE30_12375 [Polyangiaceae bacterium]|nr:hypothetical protein [Polyangiaceae bacterium]